MEFVLLAAGLNTLLPRLWERRQAKKIQKVAIETNMNDLTSFSNRLQAALGDAKFMGDFTPVTLELKESARKLSQETRDCILRFSKCEKASCTEFAAKIEANSKAIKELCDRVREHTLSLKASKKHEDRYVAKPLGMDGHVKELLKLVNLRGGPTDEGRKVISIVGSAGLGKTLLAKLVYESTEPQQGGSSQVTPAWTRRARVTAAAKDATEILREILEEVKTEGNHDKLSLEKLSKLLAEDLKGKRYFIVIDDMQNKQQWRNMDSAFPKNEDGTIIVTTTIQSVANVCSPWNGYVYNLPPLDYVSSLDLLLEDRTHSWRRCSMNEKAADILKKCDGLRLAIVSMSLILQEVVGEPTGDDCIKACKNIGTYLSRDGTDLQELRWVLMNKYTSLSCDAVRSCLLYYCMYKHTMDAVPRRNSLIRLWEAEGFLVANNRNSSATGQENLNTFIDRNIMQSMEVGTNGSTRRCLPTGMMVEFISQMSMSENFAALVSDEVPCGIRRLSFNPGSAIYDSTNLDKALKIVWTLAVSGDGCEAILNFKKYELLGVLDLKECTKLNEDHVQDICRLLLLKFLSLGKTIKKIPADIENLKLLETLEMRRNNSVLVSPEVLELPYLKHLLGNFQIDRRIGENFLSNNSRLETVTGFVSGTTTPGPRFTQLMQHMKNLRKVKIYFTPTASENDNGDLQREIEAFTSQGTHDGVRSLSIDFAAFIADTKSTSPLQFLQAAGSLLSIKLRGDWRPYHSEWNKSVCVNPDFKLISAIKKLCLSRTYLSGKAVLQALANLIALEYLKLDEVKLGPLVITAGTFKKLTRLCLVGEDSLEDITIEHEALPSLVSLHLICKHLQAGLESSIGIDGVKYLDEIALNSEVNEKTIKDPWKQVAKNHPNRPQVLLIKKGAPIRQA